MGVPDMDCSWIAKQQEQRINDDRRKMNRICLARLESKERRTGLTVEERITMDNLKYWLKEQGDIVK
jgi:hypothetical protein